MPYIEQNFYHFSLEDRYKSFAFQGFIKQEGE